MAALFRRPGFVHEKNAGREETPLGYSGLALKTKARNLPYGAQRS